VIFKKIKLISMNEEEKEKGEGRNMIKNCKKKKVFSKDLWQYF